MVTTSVMQLWAGHRWAGNSPAIRRSMAGPERLRVHQTVDDEFCKLAAIVSGYRRLRASAVIRG